LTLQRENKSTTPDLKPDLSSDSIILVEEHSFSRALEVPAPDFLAAASISPGKRVLNPQKRFGLN
jgi:hypothetical protein